MFKKIISITAALVLIITLAACSAKPLTSYGGDLPSESTSSTSSTESVPQPSESTSSTSSAESVPQPSESTSSTSSAESVPQPSESTSSTSSAESVPQPSESTSSTSPEESSSPPPAEADVPKLSNPNASAEAVGLFNYLCDTYKNNIISGQQESTWMGSEQYEFEYIYKVTGKYPAIRGLDYMNDDFVGVNRRAAEWHNRGGIVTVCWHCGCDFSGSWDECMKTAIPDWDKALTKGTAEYQTLIDGMDKAARALKELQEQNIPVLWRPFHEFDGAWFWWGKGGSENLKKLWIMMYDRYTNYWELDNLIWVLGYSGNGKGYGDWYPGDQYVDIVGADSYNDGANANLYRRAAAVAGDERPVCFHECGRIPTVDELQSSKANWVWFMTWHTDFITNGNNKDDLKAIFNDDYVITLDELPGVS